MDRENVRPDRPDFPAVVQNDGDHGNDLHQHFKFAQLAGLNGKALGRRDRAQPAYQKLARNDDHCHPGRNQSRIKLHQCDESGGDEEFVGQRVEQHPHGCDLAAPARQVSVNAIGNRSGNKKRGSQQLLFAVKGAKMTGGE